MHNDNKQKKYTTVSYNNLNKLVAKYSDVLGS